MTSLFPHKTARFLQQSLSLACVLLLLTALTAAFPAKAEPVILTVKGVQSEPVELTLSQIRALPTHKIQTETIWTDRQHTYSAVYLDDLFRHLNIDDPDKDLTMIALNDYSVDAELSTMIENQAFIAFAMDGKTMRIRDKGPLWVLYPFSDRPEINIPPYQAHAIWQLKTIVVH